MLGGPGWAVAVMLLPWSWSLAAILLTALVLVPLVRQVLSRLAEDGTADLDFRMTFYWRALAPAWLMAAPLVAVAYALDRGPVAAGLAAPWAVVTLALARLGIWRLRRRGLRPVAELAIDGALVFQIVGGAWIVVERSGWDPYSFGPVLLQLTVIHTHLSPLILLMLLGLAGRSIGGRCTDAATAASVAGFPLVAAGIIAWPRIEWIGALVLAGGGLLTVVLQLRLATGRFGGLPRWRRRLLVISSICLLAGMLLAVAFAASWAFGLAWIGRSDMLAWHGTLLALGFGVAGLLAHA